MPFIIVVRTYVTQPLIVNTLSAVCILSISVQTDFSSNLPLTNDQCLLYLTTMRWLRLVGWERLLTLKNWVLIPSKICWLPVFVAVFFLVFLKCRLLRSSLLVFALKYIRSAVDECMSFADYYNVYSLRSSMLSESKYALYLLLEFII